MKQQSTPPLPPIAKRDKVSTYLYRFELHMKKKGIPENDWNSHLHDLLTGKFLDEFERAERLMITMPQPRHPFSPTS